MHCEDNERRLQYVPRRNVGHSEQSVPRRNVGQKGTNVQSCFAEQKLIGTDLNFKGNKRVQVFGLRAPLFPNIVRVEMVEFAAVGSEALCQIVSCLL